MLKAENPAAVPTAEPDEEPPGVYKIQGQQTLKIDEILGLRYCPAICRWGQHPPGRTMFELQTISLSRIRCI